jgi:hypothetical protein
MIRRHSAAFLTAVKAEKRSKYAPESDKVSQTQAQTTLFLVLFVLHGEGFSLMSGMGQSFWTLPVMRSNNA